MTLHDLIWDIDIQGQIGEFDYDYKFQSPHSAIALIGNNGSGKSTLMRTLAGLHRPSHGYIRIGNRLLFSTSERVWTPCEARRCSYVPQSKSLFPHFTVEQNLLFALQCRDFEGNLRDTVTSTLENHDLSRLRDRLPGSLSAGEYQRVALIRSTILTPFFYVFDEPLAPLDVEYRATLRKHIADIVKQSSAPIILSTHDDRDITKDYGGVVVVTDGQIRLQLTFEQVALCDDPFLNEFFQHQHDEVRS